MFQLYFKHLLTWAPEWQEAPFAPWEFKESAFLSIESNKQLPSTLILQADNNGSKTSKNPTQLYQGCHHFVIGQNQQHKARMAIEAVSHQFTQSVVQFFQTKSQEISVRKLSKTTRQYQRLIGSEVRLRFEQLRTIGELQKK